MNDYIEREIAGTDYVCIGDDKATLFKMISAINAKMGTNVKYLAELDAFHIFGAGEIVAEYIDSFSSDSVKAYLIPQLVLDKIRDCDKIILRLYLQFRESQEFISQPGKPAPSHIYVRYDSAFHNLKSKRIAGNLLDIVSYPRDAFYLPLTTKMLASWKMPGLKEILLTYSQPDGVSIQDVGLQGDGQSYFPPYSYICRELRFTAINGLKFYPSDESLSALEACMSDPDVDIRVAARKIIRKMSP